MEKEGHALRVGRIVGKFRRLTVDTNVYMRTLCGLEGKRHDNFTR